MSLGQAIAATGRPSDIRTGEVTAVTARGVDVQVGTGLVENAAHLTSYNPAVGDTVAMMLYNDSWIILGRLLGPGTPTTYVAPGTGIGAGQGLDGCILSGTNTIIATSTGSTVTVPRYGVTYYHPPNHWVKLEWTYSWFSTVAGDTLQLRLVEAGGTTIQLEHAQVSGGVGTYTTNAVFALPSLGGAKRSWTMQLQRLSGTGTSRIEDQPVRRGSLVAYDLGDQAFIRTV